MAQRDEFRVDELAEAAGISVELLRSYQSRGLLDPPRHVGRVALYDDHHLERLRLIRDLKQRGYSLRMIEQLLSERRQGPVVPVELEAGEELLSLQEVAERTRVPPAVLRSLEASGVLQPRRVGVERRYTSADVRAVRMLLTLIGGGLPMEEFMRVARVQLETASAVAAGTVELFMRYAREPLRRTGMPQKEEAERVMAALRLMLHAATTLVSYNFQRMVLNAAQEAIEREGSRSERAALRREVNRRRFELTIPA